MIIINYIHVYKGLFKTRIEIITDDVKLKAIIIKYIQLKDKLASEKGWEFEYNTIKDLTFSFRNDEFNNIDLFKQVNDIVFS